MRDCAARIPEAACDAAAGDGARTVFRVGTLEPLLAWRKNQTGLLSKNVRRCWGYVFKRRGDQGVLRGDNLPGLADFYLVDEASIWP